MPLTAGDKLGPYEILALVGKGGMGEVYRAHDSRLNRDVAVKVSVEHFSGRFEREARAIAALNHPNICQIYDVGPNYLVMELIEGSALKGPLPVDQALRFAAQICDALDAAHKKGITHRDLKPSNILVTKAGLKLLDFGLAKVTLGPAPIDDSTITSPLTVQGEILGTLQYMSPEQVQGHEADARSDIFSFGLVLYEMLTGKRAFKGSSQASVIAAIMERAAPSIADFAPPALDHVLKTCLAKDPDERWESARDLKRELEWIASSSGEVTTIPATAARYRLLPWIAAAVLAIGLVGVSWIAYRATRPAELKPLVRLDVDLGPDVSLGSVAGADVIISPDGTRLVYVSQNRLFTQRLDQPKATEMAGTEQASEPFFSPDGQWVAFFAGGKLKKVLLEGGAPIALCDAPNARGGTWGEDGNIVVALSTGVSLSRVPESGGSPEPLTELAQREITHRWPQVLPGGKAVLFTAHTSGSGFDGANIDVMSMADHRRKTIQRGGTFGRYLPSSQGGGYLVYVHEGTLFAVGFDVDRLEVRGAPTPMLEGVSYNLRAGSAQVDFSRAGTLVYRTGASGAGLVTAQWLDSAGNLRPLLAKPDLYSQPHISPDGTRLALTVSGAKGTDIWIYDWQKDAMVPVTSGGGSSYPVWSPDGRFIVFRQDGGMFWTRADGAGTLQPLTQTKNAQYPWSFVPGGIRLGFAETTPARDQDVWTLPVESDGAGLHPGKPEPFLQTSFNEQYPAFSPDGRWLAYRSMESGSAQVWVRAFPDKGGKWLISNNGGDAALWSRNGRELFYTAPDGRIMVAAYTAQGDSFKADRPRVWSERRLGNASLPPNLDLAPDGKSFVVMMNAEGPEEQKAQNHVIFLQNFLDEVRRRTK